MIQLALTVRSTFSRAKQDRRRPADQDHQAAIVPFSSPEVASASTSCAADPAARAPGSTPTLTHASSGLARRCWTNDRLSHRVTVPASSAAPDLPFCMDVGLAPVKTLVAQIWPIWAIAPQLD
jgi:hypothetical protein